MQIDDIWINILTYKQCHVGSPQAYWTNHKPIYFAFKSPNYIPQSALPSTHKKNYKLN